MNQPTSLMSVFTSTLLLGVTSLSAFVHFDSQERMSEVDLRNLLERPPSAFVPAASGGKLYTGRKTISVDPATAPLYGNNHHRALSARIPGAMVIDEEIQGNHFNLGFRGLTPNNGLATQFSLNGFPLTTSPNGSRFVVAIPDTNQIAQVQAAPGLSSVLTGSQIGGSINFIGYPPAGDQSIRAKNTTTLGSFGYISDLLEASGTEGDYSYSAFFRYAQGDGFSVQPGFETTNAGLTLVHRLSPQTQATFAYQTYLFDADSINGIALQSAGVNNTLNYYYQTSTSHHVDVLLEHEFSYDVTLESRQWYHYTEGERDFRTTIAPTLGEAEETFHTWGTEQRMLHHIESEQPEPHLLAYGFLVQGSESPLETIPSRAGEARLDLDRSELNAALFAQGTYQLNPHFRISPGLRLEYVELQGDGFRSAGNIDREFDDVAPVFSLATEWDVIPSVSLQTQPMTQYIHFERGYRAPNYNETINQGLTTVLAGDLEMASADQIEVGVRGTPKSWFRYDASFFWMQYDDQISTVGGVVSNVGKTVHQGFELFQEIELFGWMNEQQGIAPNTAARVGPRSPKTESGYEQWGSLHWYSSIAFLDTEIKASPFAGAVGNEVPYAPEWIVKTGLHYNYFERFKASLAMRWVDDHLGNAANDDGLLRDNSAARIPAYTVVDAAFEYTLARDHVTLFINLNNLLNEDYFSALQSGTGPLNQLTASKFNAYGGVKITF